MVKERRGDRISAPDNELFEGDIWTGSQALSLGIVDALGDLRTVMRDRFGERVKIKTISSRGGLLRFWPGRAESGAARQTAQILAALEEWAAWKRFGL